MVPKLPVGEPCCAVSHWPSKSGLSARAVRLCAFSSECLSSPPLVLQGRVHGLQHVAERVPRGLPLAGGPRLPAARGPPSPQRPGGRRAEGARAGGGRGGEREGAALRDTKR